MARFSRSKMCMPAEAESELRQQLAGFVVPQTGQSLGTAGTSLTIRSTESGFAVGISCGFPLDRSREALLGPLRDFIAASGIDRPIEFELGWKVSAHAVQPGVKALPGIRNVVAIASGKGGVGKSTVTSNVALALASEGAKVGILDADIYGPSQPRILSLLGERPETRDGKTLQPLEAFGIRVMSIGFLVDEKQAVAWRGPMVTSALNQMLSQTAWGELDYLFVDMPPGTGDVQLTLAQKVPVSGAVIVTTPQDIALSDARKGLEMFRKVNLQVLGILENMSVYVCEQCGHAAQLFGADGGARLGAEYELPVLGSLPLLPEVRARTDSGQPSVVADPDGPAAQAFRTAALRIAGELAATGKDYSHLFPNVTVEGKP
jgi:ATP-binding protein involved in chromosome partitioning